MAIPATKTQIMATICLTFIPQSPCLVIVSLSMLVRAFQYSPGFGTACHPERTRGTWVGEWRATPAVCGTTRSPRSLAYARDDKDAELPWVGGRTATVTPPPARARSRDPGSRN